jgi:hypothetical protein
MNGVQLMSDIVSFILDNTFKLPKKCFKKDDGLQNIKTEQMSIIQEKIEDSVVED